MTRRLFLGVREEDDFVGKAGCGAFFEIHAGDASEAGVAFQQRDRLGGRRAEIFNQLSNSHVRVPATGLERAWQTARRQTLQT